MHLVLTRRVKSPQNREKDWLIACYARLGRPGVKSKNIWLELLACFLGKMLLITLVVFIYGLRPSFEFEENTDWKSEGVQSRNHCMMWNVRVERSESPAVTKSKRRLFWKPNENQNGRIWQIPDTKHMHNQGYIVRFGQCSVFLIPINKRRRWKLVLSLTDGALYCS
jgi:hypothetical protein